MRMGRFALRSEPWAYLERVGAVVNSRECIAVFGDRGSVVGRAPTPGADSCGLFLASGSQLAHAREQCALSPCIPTHPAPAPVADLSTLVKFR